ncbi:unnamed protein product [Caretta caretta]
MHGRKVNAEVEQRTRAPTDGLKCGWEGACLPPVSYGQARALDPVNLGGGDCRIHGLASLHPREVAGVLDHEKHVISVRQQDQPQLWLPQHQRCQPPAEETEEGLDRQSVQLAREGAPLPYSSPEADWFGQGPVELKQFAEAYSTRRKLPNWGPKPNACRVLRRYPWSTLSNAFS